MTTDMYKQLDVLQEGPDRLLWRGEQKLSELRFTIKEIRPNATDRRLAVHQLGEEYRFMRQLAQPKPHPRIARVLQWDEQAGRLVFDDALMTLSVFAEAERAAGRPLPVDLIANLLRQIGEGLEHLHQKRLGHGGLSPAGIVIGPDGAAKIGGFVGYKLEPNTALPVWDSAAKYQAPEIINGDVAGCGPWTDLYCLGYVALELLAGDRFEHLFGMGDRGPGGREVRWLGWHADPTKTLMPLDKALPDAMHSMVQMLSQLTNKNPAARGFRSVSDFLRKLSENGLGSGKNFLTTTTGPIDPPAEAHLPRLAQPGRTPSLTVPPPFRPESAPSAKPRSTPAGPRSEPGNSASKLTLITRTPSGEELKYEFDPLAPIQVGRQVGSELELGTEEVSQKHALLIAPSGGWRVYDLRTMGGTYVNGRRVRQSPLRSGDELGIGTYVFQVVISANESGPRPGTRVNSRHAAIVLGRVLHEGVHGTLFQATLSRLGGQKASKSRAVAVRVFPPDFGHNLVAIQRFLRGNVLADQVRHPNIVRLYSGGRVNLAGRAWWYLAMELMSCGSLRDMLAHGIPLDPAEVVRIGLGICGALKSAADRQLIHRNINPSCVLLDAAGAAKLSDFGLFRPEVLENIQQITQTGAAVGECHYQAPELIRGGELTPACDIYGLAATLYEACTGTPPIRKSPSLPEQVRLVTDEIPASADLLAPAVPKKLALLLAMSLSKDPSVRIQSAEEFERELLTCL